MEDHVVTISRELIKPSSPTPDHLKTLKLSLFDQFSPPVYISLIFFYEAHELTSLSNTTDDAQTSHHLKKSLSEALTLFYPLAGKIDPDNFTIDCNDTGSEFVEARVHAQVRDIVNDPKLDQFQQYLPVDPLGGVYVGQGTIFMAQVNFFDCGGIAMAVSLAHLVADGTSLIEFMDAWGAICRGENPKSTPQFGVFGLHFPPRDLSETNISPSLLMGNERLITKRFVFEKETIEALKRAGVSESVKNPTRVEAVSAFIWKCYEENKKLEMEAGKTLLVGHVVNIRSRASPSLKLEHSFGNGCFMGTTSFKSNEDGQPEIHELVSRLRRAIRRADEEYIKETQRGDGFLIDVGEVGDAVSEGEAEGFLFSSWCRFPMYEVDFGWGSPLWVCTTALQLNNLVILMSTKSGDGIEAWINLLPENIEALENQFNLIRKI